MGLRTLRLNARLPAAAARKAGKRRQLNRALIPPPPRADRETSAPATISLEETDRLTQRRSVEAGDTKRAAPCLSTWRRSTARWSLLEGSFFRASGETTASGFWPDPRIHDPAPLDPVRPACARRRGAAATSYVRPSNPSHRPGAARPVFSACASSPCGSPARLPGVPEMTVALHW